VIEKVVSGGQTGVDRAALDVALELGLPCGGWCPKGRRAEDGPIDVHYPLAETPWSGYPQRTEWNVRDSDGTLVLTCGTIDRGTRLTIELAERKRKPCLVIDLSNPPDVASVQTWAETTKLRILNVAGPREESSRGIYEKARQFLREALRGLTA
jgi:Circularly permutated YpsA SLOG family